MKTIGERINYLRTKNKLTMDELSLLIGKKKSNLSSYENGKYEPSAQTIIALCETFKVSADWLLTGKSNNDSFDLRTKAIISLIKDLTDKDIDDVIDFLKYKQFKHKTINNNMTVQITEQTFKGKVVPLAGRVAAGTPIMSLAEHDKLIPVPKEDSRVDFALTIKGDSMQPLFNDGSIIFIKKQETLENGEIGVFEIDGEFTCKKFKKTDYHISLESINTTYSPIIITEEEYTNRNFRIIGKVYINN